MKNKYIYHYRNMNLCQHTYETEKALLSRRLGSSDLRTVQEARDKLVALEKAWNEQSGKLKKLTLNADAIDRYLVR